MPSQEHTLMLARPTTAGSRWKPFVLGVVVGAVGLFSIGLCQPSSPVQASVLSLHAAPASPELTSLSGLTAADLATINAPQDPSSTLSHDDYISARVARWMVHANTWATVATTSVHLNGAPFANMISYSDGIGADATNATGRLFFYVITIGPTGKDLAANPHASVSITMAQLNQCVMDPQDPTCWKVMFSGSLVPVADSDKDVATRALFSKHPQMSFWPSSHGFVAYEMKPTEILLLDYYGGAKHIDPKVYYSVSF